MTPLMEAAGDLPLTLHRCIDVSRDLLKTYQDAAELGIDTVLTSGGASNCRSGMETIGQLLDLRDQINASVISDFRKRFPQAVAFHMSGKMDLESGMRFRRDGVPMGLPGLDEWHAQQTDPNAVKLAKIALME